MQQFLLINLGLKIRAEKLFPFVTNDVTEGNLGISFEFILQITFHRLDSLVRRTGGDFLLSDLLISVELGDKREKEQSTFSNVRKAWFLMQIISGA